MSSETTSAPPRLPGGWRRPDLQCWWWALPGLLVVALPMLWDLYQQIWTTEEQGHGPIVMALGCWLIWRRWAELNPEPTSTVEPGDSSRWGHLWLGLGALLYIAGRGGRVLSAQTLAVLLMLLGLVLLLRGPRGLRSVWFGLFFLLFMVPLPAVLVDTVTQPMKLAVSTVAAWVMSSIGYPVARSGVILQVGQYQLLVADACAGLHTLFTLEAMGLLYLNVVKYASAFRNITLAVLIVPISFAANVIRVMTLSLITFHFGDAAGQGFLHSFSGMVLFLAALLLTMVVDSLLRWIESRFRPT
ncbi:exosortase B [Ideonella livida]|uniref:Exosortase B n=1 Tax=Ideonella livida TaxID=2707176 RepID=A0A7C9PFZ7_9BURK|nr:exosortase B [Ideonella livida]NDY90915.1 exosortase B [Ideonella livida]